MTKPKHILRSTDDVIKAMGGRKAIAQWAGISEPAICQWKLSGVPPGWHYRLAIELESRGLVLDAVELGWLSKAYIEGIDG